MQPRPPHIDPPHRRPRDVLGVAAKSMSEYASEKSWPGRATMQPLPLPMSMQWCGIQRQAPAQPPPLPSRCNHDGDRGWTVTVDGLRVCPSSLARFGWSDGPSVGRRGAARSPAQPLAAVSGGLARSSRSHALSTSTRHIGIHATGLRTDAPRQTSRRLHHSVHAVNQRTRHERLV